MNVLSLFDGMSCGQIALNRAGIKYDNYFASEIKPHAINLTQKHYPNTIQVGDVTKVFSKDLPKIDLLIGGSPCQDFSIANKERLGLNGLKSSLFFEYVRLLEELKPKYFLLENVQMKESDFNFITNMMGIYPINIDSYLVSAAFRNRYYWTNIGIIENDLFGFKYNKTPQPIDKKISLQSILEYGYTDRFKARSLNTASGCAEKSQDKFYKRFTETGMVTAIFNSEDLDYNKGIRHFTQTELERLMTVEDGWTKSLTKNQAWNLLGDGWTVDVITHLFKYL
jgi:DNA (cytosine-5)-methyltransferase 3A